MASACIGAIIRLNGNNSGMSVDRINDNGKFKYINRGRGTYAASTKCVIIDINQTSLYVRVLSTNCLVEFDRQKIKFDVLD